MPAIIAAITLFFQSVGPAISGISAAISAIISLISLFHKSSPTVAGKAAAMKTLAAAAHSAHVTGNTQDLLSAVASLPNTVTE